MKTGPVPISYEQAWKKLLSEAVIEGDCLLVTRGQSIGIGYKDVRAGGRTWYVHRFAYFMTHDDMCFGTVILHTCDRPNCINEKHLVQGTHTDNVDDKVAKKRHCFGGKHYKAKLTDELVLSIRAEPKQSLEILSKKYGVGRGTILQVIRRQTWKHL